MSLLDPDAVARTINSEITGASAIAAGRMVLQIAATKLQEGQSFAVETTHSGRNYLRMMLKARNCGFEVVLVYIGTNNVEINLLRISSTSFNCIRSSAIAMGVSRVSSARTPIASRMRSISSSGSSVFVCARTR